MPENKEFDIEGIKLISDEEGYGIAHLTDKGTWEIIATFKYPGNFIRFLGVHFKELADQASSLQSVLENIDLIYEQTKKKEE